MKEEAKKIKVNEIYYTFSGEGSTSGLSVVIIRTTGCNLRCSYCDSVYSYEEGEELTFKEINKRIDYKKYKCSRVLLTGGEPLLAPYCFDLIKYLDTLFFDIILETNGSLPIEKVLPFVKTICMDIKCPSSGMVKKMHWENLEQIRVNQDEVKFIIGNREDYDFAKEIVQRCCAIQRHQFIFSPIWGKMDLATLAKWILDDKLNVRYSLQMHKVIWDKDKRGV